jgi:hypothetical protein
VHPCLSLLLGPSCHGPHLMQLDDALVTPLRLTSGSNHPSSPALSGSMPYLLMSTDCLPESDSMSVSGALRISLNRCGAPRSAVRPG